MKRKVWAAFIGWRSPQILIQITPLQWGLGGCFGEGKYGLHFGPVALVVYVSFKVEFEKSIARGEPNK